MTTIIRKPIKATRISVGDNTPTDFNPDYLHYLSDLADNARLDWMADVSASTDND